MMVLKKKTQWVSRRRRSRDPPCDKKARGIKEEDIYTVNVMVCVCVKVYIEVVWEGGRRS